MIYAEILGASRQPPESGLIRKSDALYQHAALKTFHRRIYFNTNLCGAVVLDVEPLGLSTESLTNVRLNWTELNWIK